MPEVSLPNGTTGSRAPVKDTPLKASTFSTYRHQAGTSDEEASHEEYTKTSKAPPNHQ